MIIAAVARLLSTRLHLSHSARTRASLLLAMATLCFPAAAQTAHVSSVQSTIYRQPSSALSGVAADTAGNIYVADATLNQVLRLTPSAGGYTQTVVATATFVPSAIAVDAGGNVYIADVQHNQILKEKLTGPNTYSENVFTTGGVAGTLSNPQGSAVDATGNVYIADTGNNRIVLESFAGTYTESVLPTTTSLSGPTSVAADAAGNIIIADAGHLQMLLEVPVGDGTYNETVYSTGGAYLPSVAVDATGNAYFVGPSLLLKETFVSTGNYATSLIASSGLGGTLPAIAADSTGSIYVADASNARLVKESSASASFGSIPVATSTNGVTVFFTFDSGGTAVTPTVLTQGVTGLDFADANTGTCTTNGTGFNYNPGDTCAVDVAFTPLFPGSRFGGVRLVDGGANNLASAFIYGTGTGPKVSFPSAQQSHPDTDINSAQGIAGDAGGNLFIADTFDNLIYVDTIASGYNHATIPTDTLSNPYGIALDGAGVVYVADTGNNRIFKLVPSAGTYLQAAIATGSLTSPQGIAVDGTGNLYIADTGSNRLLKETLSAGTYSETTIATSALANPAGVAVDTDGTIYIADTANGRVLKETPSAGTYTEAVVDSSLAQPTGVAVDGTGNVYVSDSGTSKIYLEALSGSSYIRITLRNNTAGPQALAFAGLGDLFYVNGTLRRLNITSAPSLGFDDSAVNATSSSASVVIANTGNATLNFPAPASGNNPSVAANFLLDSSGSSACPLLSTISANGALASGSTCTLSLSFSPTVEGSISGALVITDDNLNAAGPSYATQSIALSGNATAGNAAITFTVADHTYGDAAFTVAATSASTGAITYSVVSGPATVSGDSVTLTGTGTVVLQASQAADSNYAAGTQNATFTVTTGTAAITFTVADHNYGEIPFTLVATSASSGGFTYSVVSGPATISGGLLTLTGTGTVVLQASQAADSNYGSNTQNATFNVAAGSAPITFTVADHTYGDAFAVSATSASTGAFTYSIISGPASLSGNTVTLTGTGAVVMQAAQAADANYASSTQNATFASAAATPVITFSVADHTYGDAPFTAALNIAKNPAQNVAALSMLPTPSAPFQPISPTAPAAWTIAIRYPAGNSFSAPSSLATDQTGNVWVANKTANNVIKLDTTGAVISGTNGYAAGQAGLGLLAIDQAGSAWAPGVSAGSLLKITAGGTVSSFSGGGLDTTTSLAIDAQGEIWAAGNLGVSAFANDGTPLSPSGAFTGGGVTAPQSIAIAGR